MEDFKKLGLSDNSLRVIERKGFTEPTPIQVRVIPLLLEGKRDVVGQSQTGTGKTASFALPILERIKERSRTVQAIILTPTRELALQVAQEIVSLKGDKNIKVLAVYGGVPIGPQRQKLKGCIDIVVGTPGRVMDLQRRNSLKLQDIRYVVLDEADEMLNMGFVEDIETILKNTPRDKNMLLFSATMPKPIIRIAEKYMKKYEFIEVENQRITKTVEQIYYDINAKDRVEALRRVVDSYVDFHGIVFCNTKSTVDTLTQQLTKFRYNAAALHGDITQSQREKILHQFRNRNVDILVATDVAARGIDVNDLTHVINYSLPQSPEAYVHRIGRTGRAGKKGISITFVIPSERGKLRFVERTNNCRLEKQKIPSAKTIIENKEAKIKAVLRTIIEANTGKTTKYHVMAENLLQDHDPKDVVSAILKYGFQNELDQGNYKEIGAADEGSFRKERRPSNRYKKSRHDKRSKDRGRRDGNRVRGRGSRDENGTRVWGSGDGRSRDSHGSDKHEKRDRWRSKHKRRK